MQEKKKIAVRITTEEDYNSLMDLYDSLGWQWPGNCPAKDGTPYHRLIEGFDSDRFYICVHDNFTTKEPNHTHEIHDLTDYELIEFEDILKRLPN